MTSLTMKFRHDDFALGFIKTPNHLLNQSRLKVRMIDQVHEDAIAIGVGLQIADCHFERSKLPAFVICVYQKFDRQMSHFCLKFEAVVSKNHDDLAKLRPLQSSNDPFDESLTIDRQERLGPSHPARFACGENHGGHH